MKKYFVVLVAVLALFTGCSKDNDNKNNKDNNSSNNNNNNIVESKNLVDAVLKNKNKTENDYKKFVGGEVLNENTNFLGSSPFLLTYSVKLGKSLVLNLDIEFNAILIK